MTTKSLTRNDWLAAAKTKLKQASIDSAELDALILLEDTTGVDRAHLLASLNDYLSEAELTNLEAQLKRRLKQEPLAYIRNLAWFYSRPFYVNETVLVPRSDSEAFIDVLKTIKLQDISSMADLGSGSGCLGITAQLEFPNIQVDLYEKSPDALIVSGRNALALEAPINQHLYDLAKDELPSSDIILANLPYIPKDFNLPKTVGFEPKLALISGSDGLDLYRTLWEKLSLATTKLILTESLVNQHGPMAKLAQDNGYKLVKTHDLVQLFSKDT